jgi:hypothetical protein
MVLMSIDQPRRCFRREDPESVKVTVLETET